MKFKEIIHRITGFSTPVFGITWNPPEEESKAARRVITFLEDRRVLTGQKLRGDGLYCVESVLEIRRFLTSVLGELNDKSILAGNLQAMRYSARKFLNFLESHRIIGLEQENLKSRVVEYALFNRALGELRVVWSTVFLDTDLG